MQIVLLARTCEKRDWKLWKKHLQPIVYYSPLHCVPLLLLLFSNSNNNNKLPFLSAQHRTLLFLSLTRSPCRRQWRDKQCRWVLLSEIPKSRPQVGGYEVIICMCVCVGWRVSCFFMHSLSLSSVLCYVVRSVLWGQMDDNDKQTITLLSLQCVFISQMLSQEPPMKWDAMIWIEVSIGARDMQAASRNFYLASLIQFSACNSRTPQRWTRARESAHWREFPLGAHLLKFFSLSSCSNTQCSMKSRKPYYCLMYNVMYTHTHTRSRMGALSLAKRFISNIHTSYQIISPSNERIFRQQPFL